MGVAIAQWIRLHLASCGPGFESQAHSQCFSVYSQILCYICHCIEKRTIINKKRLCFALIFLKQEMSHEYEGIFEICHCMLLAEVRVGSTTTGGPNQSHSIGQKWMGVGVKTSGCLFKNIVYNLL